MKVKIAQIQAHVYEEKSKNLEELERNLKCIKDENIDLVTLGEMFNCPYQTPCFPVYAEMEQGETWQRLSALAKKYKIYLSAGSVPEKDKEGHVYNTAYVFERQGNQIAKHRKVHLFDIAVKDGQCYQESATLTAGDQITVFDTEFGKMGICICFDCRFPEIVRLMTLRGARMILVPAAFNMTTGPAHWELMFRGRAVDNQCYMIGTSDARDEQAGYISWGHSLVVSPWGDVVTQMDEKPGIQITEIDLDRVDAIREQLPLLSARRTDLYELKGK